MILRVSSPSPLVNLAGATRSGLWAFRNPTGVFVFEWAMIPISGGDPSAKIISLSNGVTSIVSVGLTLEPDPLDGRASDISAHREVRRSAWAKSGCKSPLHLRCVTAPMVFGSGG